MAGLVLLQSSEAPGMCECEYGYGTLAPAPASAGEDLYRNTNACA